MKYRHKILIILSLIIINITNIYAYDLCGEDIWMGWTSNEFNDMSYGAVANSNEDEKLNVKGYGRYQFQSNTNLVDFLSFADSEYFKKWIEMGKGSGRLNKYEYGLPQAWTDYYANDKASFVKKQDQYIYNNYFNVIAEYYASSGINLHEESSYVKGAVLSIVINRFYDNEISQKISKSGIQDLIDCYDGNEEAYIVKIYDIELRKHSNDDKITKRFSKEKNACIEKKEDTFDSKIGEILNSQGQTNSLTMIRELNNLNSTIFKNFLSTGKFTTNDNLEWYDSMRNSDLDFKKELGISSGVLDFSSTTSKGLNMANYLGLIEKEVVFNNANNGTDIIYMPQNTSKGDYSSEKFGSNNVAQGGASIACLSMAINKLTNSSINPKDIISRITEKYQNYNYFYDKKNKGQRNEIISEVANMYGLSCNNISMNSVIGALNSRHMVIARVQKSEFTKNGTFILLCGTREYNGKNYVIIADPNIYHTRFLYNLYDIEYIANTCKGIFFDIS